MNSPLQFDPPKKSNSRTVSGCQSGFVTGVPRSAEDTLRLIATLPAPEGLADRVQTGLRSAPRTASILRWPNALRPAGGWMHSSMARGAAAAAIVCVVAGGGWEVYSRVQPAPSARVIVMPPRVAPNGGGFSTGTARRVPQTLDGPALPTPVAAKPQPTGVAKAPAGPARNPVPGARVGKSKKTAARAAEAPAQ
jgi:hypothetical protein